MNHEQLMRGLSVHHLRFTVNPLESIVFGDQAGSALRGALYQALSSQFCSEPDGWLTPDHYIRCPVCWMLAAENGVYRGQDVPRPLTVEPPLPHVYHKGHKLTFGFSLIGQAQNLLPYLARAVQKMGENGVGKGRGRFQLVQIAEYNPIFDAERILLDQNKIDQPTLQVTPARISEAARQYSDRTMLRLEFLTPLRLIADSKLVKNPDPSVFIQRLLERCQAMATYYTEYDVSIPQEVWKQIILDLRAAAGQLRVEYNETEWVEAYSHSRGSQRTTPISGLTGIVRWHGDLSSILPWVLWGQSLHVGKDAVKGNGWYHVTH